MTKRPWLAGTWEEPCQSFLEYRRQDLAVDLAGRAPFPVQFSGRSNRLLPVAYRVGVIVGQLQILLLPVLTRIESTQRIHPIAVVFGCVASTIQGTS
jgi:hypothetical protein